MNNETYFFRFFFSKRFFEVGVFLDAQTFLTDTWCINTYKYVPNRLESTSDINNIKLQDYVISNQEVSVYFNPD